MIKLSVVSFDSKPLAQTTSAVFGEAGGTVGRGSDNHLVLHDPKNFISRTQAFVRSHQQRHSITNLSRANPLILNGVEIAYQQEHLIRPSDVLQIGLCRLFVEEASLESGAANAPDMGAAPVMPLVVTHGAPAAQPSAVVGKSEPYVHDGGVLASMTAQVADDRANQAGRFPRRTVEPNEPGAAQRDVLVQAFLRGAGLDDNTVAVELDAEFMEMIGKILSVSIQGAVDQTKMRTLVKREVNADVTMVVVRGNNPIKFLEDGQTVLMQMLRKKMPGFMAPVEAVKDAYESLYVHQLAVVAGMRAMVADMLEKLDPQSGADDSASFINNLFSANRKIRHMEDLAERYRKVCNEYRGDGAPLFGQAFLEAYERETRQFATGADYAG